MTISLGTILYFLVFIISSIIGLISYKKTDKASNYIILLTILTTVVEISSILAAEYFKYNLIIYNLTNPIELALIIAFFTSTIKNRDTKLLKKALYAICIVAATINFIFFQDIFDVFNTNFLAFESLLVVGLAQFYFYTVLINDDIHTFTTDFLFSSLLLVYWSFSFFYWLLFYGFHESFGSENLEWFGNIMKIVNTIMYASFGIIFLFYEKLRPSLSQNHGN